MEIAWYVGFDGVRVAKEGQGSKIAHNLHNHHGERFGCERDHGSMLRLLCRLETVPGTKI